MSKLLVFVAILGFFSSPQFAAANTATADTVLSDSPEIDPFDPNIDRALQEFDEIYRSEMGQSTFLDNLMIPFSGCQRKSCAVYAYVSLDNQEMRLYVNGWHKETFAISSGASGHDTPSFDKHPDGRIYDHYTSTKYPQGDYQGLGNMPYAVFISGGFAIHGTTEGNFRYLGRRASHGCIRLHPDNAYIFNRLVRQYGIANTWITVE